MANSSNVGNRMKYIKLDKVEKGLGGEGLIVTDGTDIFSIEISADKSRVSILEECDCYFSINPTVEDAITMFEDIIVWLKLNGEQ